MDFRESVHVLTSRDIQSGRYSMEDVVLPIVGTSTICPENKVASRLKELLAVAGVTLASFRWVAVCVHITQYIIIARKTQYIIIARKTHK